MQKLTLPFVKTSGNIPVVRIPLAGGKSICAIIDTGSDSTLYDAGAKENYPEMVLKSKSMGTQKIIGVNKESEMEVVMSRLKLDVQKDAEESLTVKMVAVEHKTFCETMKPLVEREGIKESVPLLIGSDTLIHYNARIDMKKRVICLSILNPKRKKKAA